MIFEQGNYIDEELVCEQCKVLTLDEHEIQRAQQ
jgi:hypothetical protein